MLFLKILKGNKFSFFYIFLLLISTIAFSSTLIFLSYKFESSIQSFSIFNWIIVLILLNFTMALSLTSTTIAAILLGYFLGWSALLFYVIIYLTSTVTGNFLARVIDKGKLLNSIKSIKSTEKYLSAIEEEQLPLIIIARISPIFPFSIMNVFLAAINFKLKKILIGSLIGMLPRTLICFWIGGQLSQIRVLLDKGIKNNLFEISAIVLVLVALIGLYVYINKILKRAAGKFV